MGIQLLGPCNLVMQLEQAKVKYLDKMYLADRHYLKKLDDECQYPAARCTMGGNICMFGKSASSGVESINGANQLARQRTAVDILNAVILLLKPEVTIPSKGLFGSRFGTCTCGKPAKDGVPCKQMMVVVKSISIEGLSRIQIMPYW